MSSYTSMQTKYFDKQIQNKTRQDKTRQNKTKQKMKNGLIRMFAQILPELCPNLPEFYPNIAKIFARIRYIYNFLEGAQCRCAPVSYAYDQSVKNII